MSRELGAYLTLSPVARAAQQLSDAGKTMRPGQSIHFVLTRGEPGVYAWGLPSECDLKTIDIPQYQALLQRAVQTIIQTIMPKERQPDIFELDLCFETSLPAQTPFMAVEL